MRRGTQYSSKRLCAKRTFVWSRKQGTGVGLRKYAVYFGFANQKAKMNIYAEGIWWTDGKEILRWEKRWQNHYTEQKYVSVPELKIERGSACARWLYAVYDYC